MTWPAAVLFDLDGTLVDSEGLWQDAKAEVARQYGAHWAVADARWAEGRATPEYAGRIAGRATVPTSMDVVSDAIGRHVGAGLATGRYWRPGALLALETIRGRGVRTALVTMSYRAIVDELLTSVAGSPFDVIVAGDEVSRPKPDPEPYTRALELLDVTASSSVAVEDTRSGATSALAAGVRTVLVPSAPIGEQLRGCSVVESLGSESFWNAVRVPAQSP